MNHSMFSWSIFERERKMQNLNKARDCPLSAGLEMQNLVDAV